MATSIQFLLSNQIENTTIVDRLANLCLAPLRGVMQLCGRSVKVYHVYLFDNAISDETSAVTQSHWTLCKVCKYTLFFVFFIPTAIPGIALKKIALYSSSLRRKCAVLFDQLNKPPVRPPEKEDSLKSLIFPTSLPRPALVDELTLNIFQYLVPNTVASLSCINRSFRIGINKYQSILVNHFRKQFHGIPKALNPPTNLTFRSLNKDILIQEQTYYDNPGQLYEMFGSREKLMRYPVFESAVNGTIAHSIEVLNEFAFRKSINSPIVRIRNPNRYRKPEELIIIKFSTCIPLCLITGKKKPETTRRSEKDILIWHDCLILSFYPGGGEVNRWVTSLLGYREHVERVQFIDAQGIQQSSLREYGDDTLERSCPSLEFLSLRANYKISFDHSTRNIMKLIKTGSGVFFNKESNKLPLDILGSLCYPRSDREVHENFPIVLGHITDPTVFQKTQEHIPDLIADTQGNLVPNPNKSKGDPSVVTKWSVVREQWTK